MVYFEQRVTVPPETRVYIYVFAVILFFLASSIVGLSCVLWRKSPMQAIVHCNCRKIEERKQK